MKKSVWSSAIAGVLVMVMILGSVLSWMPMGEMVLVQAATREKEAETEKSYVITVKDDKTVKSVCNKHKDILEISSEKNSEMLLDEGLLVSDMTVADAQQLEYDRQVLAVEENFVLEGCARGEKKHIGKRKRSRGSGLARENTEYINAGHSENWNLEAIRAADADNETTKGKGRVRVAVLDSGVDTLDNIEVKERVNLIPGQEDFSVLFEDEAGHGTAVAGIIAGETMEGETAEGINRNVELYSVKVLDENNQAPLSRIIEGIYWAIEKDVHIINMSFGTSRYSKALEDAVKAASDKGILMIAAAGNQGNDGTDTVEYPAAFSEVLAVGSVDARGEVCNFSAKGDEVELVAPGEAVRVTGAFGADMIVSGTSMAAPHVTAVASLLWEKDLSKSAEFIRRLLDESARNLGSEIATGYGLIDYEYAQKVYDKVESQMESGKEVDVPENDTKVQVFDNSEDVKRLEEAERSRGDTVTGSWKWEVHREYLDKNNVNLPAMRAGAVYPDKEESGVKGMYIYPDFHGYFQTQYEKEINYIASYHYIIKVAEAYGKGKDYTSVSKVKGLSDISYKEIRKGFKGMNKKIKSYVSNKDRKAFVYGIAMHTATDAFSHSTMLKVNGIWYRIQHHADEVNPTSGADQTKIQPRRHTMALRVERNVLYRYKGKRNDVPVVHDFHASGDTDGTYYTNDTEGKLYRVIRIQRYAKTAGVINNTVLKHLGLLHMEYSEHPKQHQMVGRE